jgi:hypothetical protein
VDIPALEPVSSLTPQDALSEVFTQLSFGPWSINILQTTVTNYHIPERYPRLLTCNRNGFVAPYLLINDISSFKTFFFVSHSFTSTNVTKT